MPFQQAHAVVVGVGSNQFAPNLDVPVAVADANAVVGALKDSQACGYPDSQVTFLNNDQASRNNILEALVALAQNVSKEDTVFFYYCGHGSLGTDGNYYLVSHDAKIDAGTGRVVKNTGVSETELLQHLRAIPSRRVLLVFNTSFSGRLSPTQTKNDLSLATSSLPEDLAHALVGTGDGRLVITACREDQSSYMGDGKVTIFTQALVDGLFGKGVRNSGGYIGVYSLYEHVYRTVSEFVKEKYNLAQEPELTVMQGAAPFAVALYRGASSLDRYDAEQPIPDLSRIRQVKPEKSQEAFSRCIDIGEAKAESGGVINVAGGDITQTQYEYTITEETSYDVTGLENPYLGLRAFGYEDRNAFGGRDEVIQKTVEMITKPGSEQVLLFITGASGSGKSSFAQAGLLPGLEDYYNERYEQKSKAIFRPSNEPLSMLADALHQLKLSKMTSLELSKMTPQAFARFISEQTPKEQVNLLVIDQFEECFTLASPAQREIFFSFLAALPSFDEAHTHIIVTLRSDFLDELFGFIPLYEYSKKGVDLRKMDVDELKEAIQKPLWAASNTEKGDEHYGQKRFEPALLDRLAEDASPEATYLPLLQITLRELWNGGSLKLSKYKGLTAAIQRRAEAVYKYEDYEESDPKQERKPEDQKEISNIFIDLVDVTNDEDTRRDVRKRRAMSELVGHSSQRERLVADLIKARLLSVNTVTSGAEQKEMIDIIHESLIKNWGDLAEAVDKNRVDLRKRARFEQEVKEWLERGKSEYPLTGVRLKEALELEKAGDVALKSDEAQELLRHSKERQTRNIFMVSIVLSIALLVAIVAAGSAFVSSKQSAVAKFTSEAAKLAAEAAYISAKTAEFSALNSESTAVAERIISDHARSTAQSAEQKAVDQRLVAEKAESIAQAERDRAEEQATISLARQLSAQAQELLISQPEKLERAALLSIESLRVYSESVGSQALANSLQLLPTIVYSMSQSSIVGVAFSPDGQRVLMGGSDGTVWLWDAAIGPVINENNFGENLTSMAFSPDNQRVVSGSGDGTILISEMSSGPLHRVTVNNYVYSVDFNLDGSRVVAGSDDGAVRVWNVEDGTELTTMYHADSVFSVDFSSDGSQIVSGCEDGTVRVWDANSAKEVISMRHSGPVHSVAFSHNGQYIVSGSEDGTARVWEVVTGREVARRAHNDKVTSVAFSPDDRYVVSGSDDGTARMWEATSGKEVSRFTHPFPITAVEFSPINNWVLSGSTDGTAWVWEAASGQEISRVNHEDAVNAVAVGEDVSKGRIWVASASQDTQVLITEPVTGKDLPPLKHRNWVGSIAFSPNGRYVVSGSGDNTARVWEVETGQEIARITHAEPVRSVAFSSDGQQVVSGSEDFTVRILNISTKTEIKMQHDKWVYSVAFSPNGKWIVSGSGDHTARVWEAVTGLEVSRKDHTDQVLFVAFHPNGRWVLSSGLDGQIIIWDVETREEIVQRKESFYTAVVAFSPNGQWVVSGSAGDDGAILVWDAADGKEITRMNHEDSLRSVAFSPDGLYVISGSLDRTARVWEASTGRELARETHDMGVTSVAFSPDGQWVVSSSYDGAVLIWYWRPEDLIELACARLGRNLTQDEWLQYFGDLEYHQTCPNLPPGKWEPKIYGMSF